MPYRMLDSFQRGIVPGSGRHASWMTILAPGFKAGISALRIKMPNYSQLSSGTAAQDHPGKPHIIYKGDLRWLTGHTYVLADIELNRHYL